MKKDRLFIIIHLIEDPLDAIKYAGNEDLKLKVPSIQIDNFSDTDLLSMIMRSGKDTIQSFLFKAHSNPDVSRLNSLFGYMARTKSVVYVQGNSANLESVLQKFHISFTLVHRPEDLLL